MDGHDIYTYIDLTYIYTDICIDTAWWAQSLLRAPSHPPTHWPTLQHTRKYCNALRALKHTQHGGLFSFARTMSPFNTLTPTNQTATHGNTQKHTETQCNVQSMMGAFSVACAIAPFNTLNHTATHCNTLQHTAHTGKLRAWRAQLLLRAPSQKCCVAGHADWKYGESGVCVCGGGWYPGSVGHEIAETMYVVTPVVVDSFHGVRVGRCHRLTRENALAFAMGTHARLGSGHTMVNGSTRW